MKKIFKALLELYIFNILKSDYQLPKKCFKCFNESPRSQDIYVFVLTFWSCRKNGLIREIRFISTFMMSQPG